MKRLNVNLKFKYDENYHKLVATDYYLLDTIIGQFFDDNMKLLNAIGIHLSCYTMNDPDYEPHLILVTDEAYEDGDENH